MSALASYRAEANRLHLLTRNLSDRIMADDGQSPAKTATLGIRLAVALRELDDHIVDTGTLPVGWNV
jgi:hypothetical protein